MARAAKEIAADDTCASWRGLNTPQRCTVERHLTGGRLVLTTLSATFVWPCYELTHFRGCALRPVCRAGYEQCAWRLPPERNKSEWLQIQRLAMSGDFEVEDW